MAVVDPTKGFDLPKFVKRILDLTGQRFERLVVVSFAGRNGRNLIVWNCLCDCGNTALATSANLRNTTLRNRKRSCGCLAIDVTRERSITHGSRHTPEYRSWRAMKDRCLRPGATGYDRYGGRGITICERWLNSFQNFLADMGPQPEGDYSLDRHPDNNGHYEPGNCRWATGVEQSNNRRKAKPRLLIEFNGESLTPGEWAKRLGIQVGTIYSRRWKGLPVEQVLA
jgi:hypothetical protein